MRKISLILTGIALMSMASCMKTYTCTCDKKNTATGAALQGATFEFESKTKKHSKEMCPSAGQIPNGETWTCSIK